MRQNELDLVGAREGDAAGADVENDLGAIEPAQRNGCRRIVRGDRGVREQLRDAREGMKVLHGQALSKTRADGGLSRRPPSASNERYEVAHLMNLIASLLSTIPPSRRRM